MLGDVRGCWLLVLLVACAVNDADVSLRFTPDPGRVGRELYQCFGFDVSLLGGRDLGAIRYVQAESPVSLHHMSLWATPSLFPDGPIECQDMPADAVEMNAWVAGSGDLVLAPNVSLVIPEGTQRLVVQAHSLRIDDGPAVERELVLEPRAPAEQRATWFKLLARVPVIEPHVVTESSSTCTLLAPLHVVLAWPHMHRMGIEFHGLVDVVPWQFDNQRTYPLEVDLAAGAVIGTRCVWQNTTDAAVYPGFGIDDEMCGQAAIVYPYTNALAKCALGL
jgi:hypothetical protein